MIPSPLRALRVLPIPRGGAGFAGRGAPCYADSDGFPRWRMTSLPPGVRSGLVDLRAKAADLRQGLGQRLGRPWGSPARSARLLGIGHSHLSALAEALAGRAPRRDLGFRLIPMIDPRFEPNLRHVEGGTALNQALQAYLRAEEAAGDADVPFVFDCVSGNEHHFLGLVNHVRPFDFVLADAPGLPLTQGAEIIPAELMRERMHHAIGMARHTLAGLRAATSLPIWHLQSPPPVPDPDHIRRHPSVFAAAVAEHGVGPATLRLKLWRLQSEAYRAACAELGIGFLPAPPVALDPDGFLRPAGWNPDPTHASAWYGALVLDQVEALFRATPREART